MRKLLLTALILAAPLFIVNGASGETGVKDTLTCPNAKVIETINKGSREERLKTADLKVDMVQKWFRDLPGWKNKTDPASLMQVIQGNCKTRQLPNGWANVCQQFKSTTDQDVYRFVEKHFTPYQLIVENENKGTFTSYYASYVNVSKTKTDIYKHPIYKSSAKARTLSRKQIEQGNLPDSQVLYWADNAFDTYVLGVQGSGVGKLPDGKKVKILYGAKNSDNYVSLGKVLIECGEIERAKMSLPAIRQWVDKASNDEYQRLVGNNQSYVFFREGVYNGESPAGALGVPLTPMRSLAVDTRYIPLGTMTYVEVPHPLNDDTIAQVFIAQDKGGAINGGIRADIFAGEGDSAAAFAGQMKHRGRFWVIKPKG